LRPVKSTGKMSTPVKVPNSSSLPAGVEHDDAFLDDWEPLPFFETPNLDDVGFIDLKATPPKTGMNTFPHLSWTRTMEANNNYWQGHFPTHFLSDGTVLSDAGFGMTAIITPEQTPRDVIQLQQCYRGALPFSVTHANDSTSPTSFVDNISSNKGATLTPPSAASPFISLPQELLIDPIYLQHHTPPPPDLKIMQMPKYTPPCNFMALTGGPQSIGPPLDSPPFACVSMSNLVVTNSEVDLEDTRHPFQLQLH
jgi:hypothetical protein